MFKDVTFPVLLPDPGNIIAMHALNATGLCPISLLALNQEAELWRLDLHSGIAVKLLQVDIPGFNPAHPQQLVLSKMNDMPGSPTALASMLHSMICRVFKR